MARGGMNRAVEFVTWNVLWKFATALSTVRVVAGLASKVPCQSK